MQEPPVAYEKRSQTLTQMGEEIALIIGEDMMIHALRCECDKQGDLAHVKRSGIFEKRIAPFLFYLAMFAPLTIGTLFSYLGKLGGASVFIAALLVVIFAAVTLAMFLRSSYVANALLDDTYEHAHKEKLVLKATGSPERPLNQTLLADQLKIVAQHPKAREELTELLSAFYETFTQKHTYIAYKRRESFVTAIKKLLKSASHYELLDHSERQTFHQQVETCTAQLKLFTFANSELEQKLNVQLTRLKQQS